MIRSNELVGALPGIMVLMKARLTIGERFDVDVSGKVCILLREEVDKHSTARSMRGMETYPKITSLPET